MNIIRHFPFHFKSPQGRRSDETSQVLVVFKLPKYCDFYKRFYPLPKTNGVHHNRNSPRLIVLRWRPMSRPPTRTLRFQNNRWPSKKKTIPQHRESSSMPQDSRVWTSNKHGSRRAMRTISARWDSCFLRFTSSQRCMVRNRRTRRVYEMSLLRRWRCTVRDVS